ARNSALQERIIALAADDAQLRFQVALSLGQWDDDRILPSLAHIAVAGVDDHWTRMAVESSVPHRAGALIVTLCRANGELLGQVTPGRLTLLRELAALAGGRRDVAEVADVLNALTAIPGKERMRWQMAGLRGLA